jgi:uncharacterized protein DUF1153
MDGSPEGQVLICTNCTTVDLSPSDTKRLVARRKAAVVTAVRNGAIGLEEACRRYELSEEEFLAWKWGIAKSRRRRFADHPVQIYHQTPRPSQATPRY